MHYLDNAATTPLAPGAARAIDEARRTCWGNPSALYALGDAAHKRLWQARTGLAALLGAKPPTPRDCRVYFTGGGTEASNIAVQGAVFARAAWARRVVAAGYEHPAVRQALSLAAARAGMEIVWVAPSADGNVCADELAAAVDAKTALVCAMHVNNETGAVLDVAALADAAKQINDRCFVHVDGVQAFGKLPLALGNTNIDAYAVSAHKLCGPRGVGALYLKSPTSVQPLLGGGGQEGGLRPGTEDVAGAAGFEAAAREALEARERDAQTIAALRARLLQGLARLPEPVTLHTPPGGYAGIVMFSLPKGLKSQVMQSYLDGQYGVCVSNGSACNRGAKPSHTLAAMGVPGAQLNTALRVSLCGQNTGEDIDALLCGLESGIKTLARE